MERIRTYNLADLRRAERFLSDNLGRGSRMHFDLYRQQWKKTSELAGEMYKTHKDWIEEKIDPLIPYLQGGKRVENKTTRETVEINYASGLDHVIYFGSTVNNASDLQDVIVASATRFITTLQVCKRLDVSPGSALEIAKKSCTKGTARLPQLFKENSDLPKIVVERAATNYNPELLLKRYKQVRDEEQKLGDTWDKDEDNTSHSLFELVDDSKVQRFIRFYKKTEYGKRYDWTEERLSANAYNIDAPLIRQRHRNWCGYTSESMALQYYGYSDLTPEKIFTHINGQYDPILEHLDPGSGPDVDSLALAVQELTPLQARIVENKDYEEMKRRKPKLSSPLAVLDTFLIAGIPCMVRVPGHWMLATGVDKDQQFYYFNNPFYGNARDCMTAEVFEDRWSSNDDGYPRDTRHLMLAIYPKKKKN